jgi:ADP-heptose:LPS heptosyltransferase
MTAPALLALRALGLGDLLTAVPALRALADAFPRHRRVLALPAPLALLALHTGAVDEVLPSGPLAPLPVRRPDVAVNLHGRGPESHRVLLATAPRRLVAFASPAVPESAGGPAWRDGEHEVRRWCRLFEAHGIAADPGRLDLAAPPGAPPWARGATVLHPGAGFAARRWPAGRWAAVARAERAGGRRVLVTGGRQETALAARVAGLAGLDPGCVLAGRTTALELAAIVGAAGRVVCADTGVAHLATALRRPSVILFGPTAPAAWGPPTDRPWHRSLWAGVSGDARGDEVHAGLLAITVGDVLAELAALETSGAEVPA